MIWILDSIPDSNISASSELNISTPAKNGRLNYTVGSSWCASTNNSNPYLQIDLQTLHIICVTTGFSCSSVRERQLRLQRQLDNVSGGISLGALARLEAELVTTLKYMDLANWNSSDSGEYTIFNSAEVYSAFRCQPSM